MANERTYQIVIGVLVLIIIIGGWFAFAGDHSGGITSMFQMSTATSSSDMSDMTGMGADTAVATPTSSASAGTTMADSGESVSVLDQAAGMKVAVQSLTVNQPSWVAVRDVNGRTLGAALFPSGTVKNVTVPLLRATVAGARYQVLLYADNGAKKFDLHADTLITGADGSVAGTTFSAK